MMRLARSWLSDLKAEDLGGVKKNLNRSRTESNFKHTAFYGTSGNGKTWCAKKWLKSVAKRSNAPIFIHTPVGRSGYPARSKIFHSIDDFVQALENHKRNGTGTAYVYIDEFQEIMDYYGSFQGMPSVIKQITSIGRHYGFVVGISAQRPPVIPPTIRNNCKRKIVFGVDGVKDRKLVADESPIEKINGRPFWKELGLLPKLSAYLIEDGRVKKIRI